MTEQVRIEQRGRVMVARLDNPPHALMGEEMLQEIDALVRRVDADDEIGAVVFTGAQPGVFLAHYDVGELLTLARQSPPISETQAGIALRLTRRLAKAPRAAPLLERTPVAGLRSLQRFHETLVRIGRSGTIFIAAINGATAGGGLELALACDLRYLSDQGEVAQPEVLLGFPPGGGGTQRMTRLIGRAAALEIMLTGRSLSPAEAERVGLVHYVVPHDELLDVAVTTAARLATRFKPAVSVIKRAVLEGGSLPLEEGLLREQAGFLAMLGEEDVQRAMAAYVEFTESRDMLPARDDSARQQLEDGVFSPFHAASTDSGAV